MKKLFILLILMSGFAFGQFTVVETSNNWIESGQIFNNFKLYQNKEKTKAKIEFLNINKSLSKSQFVFSVDATTLDKLYDLIKQKYEEDKVQIITLDFPEGVMYLNFYKSLGTYNFNFRFTDKTNPNVVSETIPIGLNELNKLFNKSTHK